jgi:hypothetical protein
MLHGCYHYLCRSGRVISRNYRGLQLAINTSDAAA